MFEISMICYKTGNISLCKYLFVGETTMNIIKLLGTKHNNYLTTYYCLSQPQQITCFYNS